MTEGFLLLPNKALAENLDGFSSCANREIFFFDVVNPTPVPGTGSVGQADCV